MSTKFADKLFAIGYRAAFQLFRHPAKANAAHQDRADNPAPTPGESWLSPPTGVAKNWEAALGAHRDDAAENEVSNH